MNYLEGDCTDNATSLEASKLRCLDTTDSGMKGWMDGSIDEWMMDG